MKKPIIALLSAALFTLLGSAHADAKKEMTVEEAAQAISSIKKSATRDALQSFYTACASKIMAKCHMAWFDLHDAGLEMIYHIPSGLSTWQFEGDARATSIHRAITLALGHPAYHDAWNLLIKPVSITEELPSEILARHGLTDQGWWDLSLEIVDQHFRYARVPYDVWEASGNARAEWARYLALMYAVRGDKNNSYISLEEMKKYGKFNNKEAALYERTAHAITKYLRTKGVK